MRPENSHERMQVVREVKTWLGTPYHHHAQIKKVGVDCAMLPIRVYCDLGLVPPVEIKHYPPDWHLHRNEEEYLAMVRRYARDTDSLAPGNFVVYKWGRCFAHGGIITEWPFLANAMNGEGVVISNTMQEPFKGRDRLVFTIWE